MPTAPRGSSLSFALGTGTSSKLWSRGEMWAKVIAMDIETQAAFAAINDRLARMEHKLDSVQLSSANIIVGGIIMSQEMDQLVAAVEADVTVDQSVLTFLQGIAAQIADAAGDRARSLALAQTVTASTDAVRAALIANTPAATV